MAKRLTVQQLRKAIKKSPRAVKQEGQKFLVRGLAEYKRVAVQSPPWRVGQSGGGVPVESGNLRERHFTRVNGFVGRFGVDPNAVRYAEFVHDGTKNMRARPWLDYAFMRGDRAVEKHYKVMMGNILKIMAT